MARRLPEKARRPPSLFALFRRIFLTEGATRPFVGPQTAFVIPEKSRLCQPFKE
jgi:hypothetical protein